MTEKNYNPEQKMKKVSNVQEKVAKVKVEPTKVVEKKVEDKKKEEIKKETKKKVVAQKKAPKKTEVVVNAKSVPVSTKYSVYICKFIKNKPIQKAITDLEFVLQEKKAVPMKGEIPHKKGKGMMSGRYPKRAVKHFITILKGLQGNANNHELNEPIVSGAIANKAQRPLGRFGKWQRKRTHITLKAKEKKIKKKETKGGNE